VLLKAFSIELAKSASIGIILAQLGEFSLLLANVASQSQIIGPYGQKLIICVTALSLSISPLFISLSTKTKNLSFVGDNSVSSIMKVLFSRKFSKEVRTLSVKSAELRSK
jgi:CPA2 family monovalent cation:H+ antiporter-2